MPDLNTANKIANDTGATNAYPYQPLGEEGFSFRELCERAVECLNHPWTEPFAHGAPGSSYTQAGVDFMMLDLAPTLCAVGALTLAIAIKKMKGS